MNIDQISEAALAAKPAYADIIQFFTKVFRLQEAYKARLDLEKAVEKEFAAADATTSVRPVLPREAFPLDIAASASLLKDLCMIEGRDQMTQAETAVRNAVQKDADFPEMIFRSVLNADRETFLQTGEKIGVDPNVLEFYGQESIEPSVVYVSEKIAERYFDGERGSLKGYCPVCGSLPSFALIRENAKRNLVCSFCKHQWPVNRIYCPWCENTDQKTMKYLLIDQEEAYRISVCEKCNHYVKTLVIEKSPYPFHAGMEFYTTLHLDMAAVEKGFLHIKSGPAAL